MILPCRWNVAVFSFFPTPSQPLFTLIRFLLCNDSNSNPNLLSYVSFCTFGKSSKKWTFETDEAWGVVQKKLKMSKKETIIFKIHIHTNTNTCSISCEKNSRNVLFYLTNDKQNNFCVFVFVVLPILSEYTKLKFFRLEF